MCRGLSCAVVGCHGNGSKLRYSFKVLVLRTRTSGMYARLAALKLNTECKIINNKLKRVFLSFCRQNPLNFAPIGSCIYAHVRSSVFNAV